MGVDPLLEINLETHFQLNYPKVGEIYMVWKKWNDQQLRKILGILFMSWKYLDKFLQEQSNSTLKVG